MPQLSEHFSASEFACQCGCGFGTNPGDVSEDLLWLLEDMREELERPIVITSGCRCKYHNGAVGGVVNSRHVTGEAADVRVVSGRGRYEMIQAVYSCCLGDGGIGVAKTFIHVDVHPGSPECPRPSAWSY